MIEESNAGSAAIRPAQTFQRHIPKRKPVRPPFDTMVKIELVAARAVNADINSLHEGYAYILEELEGLWAEIRERSPDRQSLEVEIVQVATMCQRLYEDVIAGME